ncbi:MAG: polysaccharide biosynthesis protein PslG [Solirubrobacterales bacterium]|nr:polysaccharide biosynthesis protein PslG [Solirubrobacterales bacterium]
MTIAVAALTLAGSPPGAGAKPSHRGATAGLFGTTVWEPPTIEEFQRMAAGGLSDVRLIFFPGAVEQQPGWRDWRLYDKLVGDAARGGMAIDPMLFGVPGWMDPDPSTLPVQSQAQENFWFAFVRDAARRYGPGGQFWAQNPGLTPHPMRNWEVWNEPNINEFTGEHAQVKAREFARLLRITRAALNAASPANRIVLGGLYRRPRPGHGIRMTRFLERLYKLRHGRSLFDAVAIHPYAARPRQILRVTESARRVMNANGDTRKPIWITEVGWTTGGNYWSQSLYRATPQQQATRVRGTARILLAHRRQLRLRRVDWYTWRDFSGGDNFWDKYMGLFTADGHPKPAWTALTQITGGTVGGVIKNLGHKPLPPGPGPAPGGGGSQPPSPPPCLLPGILC